jgi:hypothetical protein
MAPLSDRIDEWQNRQNIQLDAETEGVNHHFRIKNHHEDAKSILG